MEKWKKYVLIVVVCLVTGFLVVIILKQGNNWLSPAFFYSRDTTVINQYLVSADTSFYSDKEAAVRYHMVMSYSGKADSLSIRVGYRFGRAKSYFWRSKAFLLMEQRDSARLYARRAIDIFSVDHHFVDLARTYYHMGDTYGLEGEDMLARISNYEEAARFFDLGESPKECARTLQLLADFCMLIGDNLKSRRVLNNAIDIYEKANIIDQKGAYDLLNLVETRLGNYQKGYEYGLKALEIARAMGDSTNGEVATIINRTGVSLFKLKRYDDALKCFKRALDLFIRNEDFGAARLVTCNLADSYNITGRFDSSIAIIERFPEDLSPLEPETRIAFDQFLLGAYTGKGDSVRGQRLAGSLYRRLQSRDSGINKLSYVELTEYSLRFKNIARARVYITEAEPIFRSMHEIEAFRRMREFRYVADSLSGELPAAIHTLIENKAILDSIFFVTRQKQLTQLEKQFAAEMRLKEQIKQQRAELLKAGIELKAADLNETKTISVVILCCLLLLFVFAGIIYRIYALKQKNSLLLREQKESINRQNISLKNLADNQVKLIAEKEWLVREVHHRVKNNLQMVVSLLNIQSKFLKDESALAAINTSQNRIRAMSFIHQHLYQAEMLKSVNVKQYILNLVTYLKDALDIRQRLEFQVEVAEIDLNVGEVIAIGLIINELVTNTVKYAFPGMEGGLVKISLNKSTEGGCIFVYKDNGVGLKQSIDWRECTSLGFNLIKTMSEQLNAVMSINGEHGLQFDIRFVHKSYA